jgi:hypothetical protein
MEKTQYDDDEPFSLSSSFATNEKKKGENDNEPLVRHCLLVVNEKKKEER